MPSSDSSELSGQLADILNERARRYTWCVFNQQELEVMTGLPRMAIRRAFEAPEVNAQFGKARPEEIIQWVRKQEKKIKGDSLRS